MAVIRCAKKATHTHHEHFLERWVGIVDSHIKCTKLTRFTSSRNVCCEFYLKIACSIGAIWTVAEQTMWKLGLSLAPSHSDIQIESIITLDVLQQTFNRCVVLHISLSHLTSFTWDSERVYKCESHNNVIPWSDSSSQTGSTYELHNGNYAIISFIKCCICYIIYVSHSRRKIDAFHCTQKFPPFMPFTSEWNFVFSV